MSNHSPEAVRQEVRAWLSEHWNPDLSLVAWRNMLVDAGWGQPEWPKEWYGRDYSAELVRIVEQEFGRVGAVTGAKSGIRLLAAATLLEHGSDEHKSKYLRRIITGEDTWCQLFSEPGSGSDLAGATTRADLKGDHWAINGQKVWTTSAHHADFGLLLARTDWDAPKHRGLTFFVIDMHQPGVVVQPLKQMNGHASFNQVFLTDAQVPRENQVSRVGNGWAVAMTTLAHERRRADGLRSGAADVNRQSVVRGRIHEEEAEENATVMAPYTWYLQRAGRVDLALPQALATGRITDPVVRQELARLLCLSHTAEWTARRARAAQQAGKPQGPEGSRQTCSESRGEAGAEGTHPGC